MAGYFNENSENEKADRPLIDEAVKFVRAIRKHIFGLLLFEFVPPFLRHYFSYFKNKSNFYIQNLNYINQRMDSIIKKRRHEIENTPLDKPLPNDLLTSIITANTSRGIDNYKSDDDELMRPLTDIEVRGIILDGILAGTDTTANLDSFIIYYLGRYPDVRKKMIDEIGRIFQDNKTRPITKSDVHNLKYCEAIAKEVARIFPVVDSFSRSFEKPEEIGGYQWPVETMVKISIDAVHHGEEYWDEPNKFNPNRWMFEDFAPKKIHLLCFVQE
ncbi:cytochrome P450 [Rhizophagus clarus]|nr:cytochrome P450 [Rhizophagus clarus]